MCIIQMFTQNNCFNWIATIIFRSFEQNNCISRIFFFNSKLPAFLKVLIQIKNVITLNAWNQINNIYVTTVFKCHI